MVHGILTCKRYNAQSKRCWGHHHMSETASHTSVGPCRFLQLLLAAAADRARPRVGCRSGFRARANGSTWPRLLTVLTPHFIERRPSAMGRSKALKQLKLIIITNLFILIVAWINSTTQEFASATTTSHSTLIHLAVLYLLALIRIAVIVRWFEWVETVKPKIYGDKRRTLKPRQRRAIYVQILAYVATTDAVGFWLAEQRALPETFSWAGMLLDAVLFVSKSLIFEMIFDFFHYATHWYCHQNPWLYRNVHKRHHLHLHPCALSTFEQDGLDVFLTNFLPLCVAVAVGPRFTPFQLHLQFVYKTYVEVAGHSGLDIHGSSFPQLPPLHEVTGACLEVHDHDLHHTHPNWNFAKRFSIWDKMFGTFRSGKAVAHHDKTSK